MISPTISRDLIAMSSAPFTPPTRSLGPIYARDMTLTLYSRSDKTLIRFGDWSVEMRDVRADQNAFENASCEMPSL